VRNATLVSLILHLRLPFQLLLAPVFLWGWLLAGGGLSVRIAIAFVCLHAFLYAGATAFNSYYDRDEGPIGGLERPPPVVPALLPLSLAMQAIGLVLAFLVNLPFVLLYGGFAALSFAYSHPRIRLKGHPIGSLLTVGIGQGGLAFLCAWAAVRGEIDSAGNSLAGSYGAVVAALLILALYPLTQLHQVGEDRARGDRTVAVAWGAPACFVAALALLLLGGAGMVFVVRHEFGNLDALLVSIGIGLQLAVVAWWALRYDPRQILTNYRRVMRLNVLGATALGGYLLARLSGVLSPG
jgi:1,4-dihydroxy-2-naphthoate octaprenyltransferase